ncbi:galactolipid galactosyltransferase SFR2, chloroplastic-like [Lotus japonicus]|uniref:galactolipid galactosyltransferase SFR2, chloroplastic-like n=1 Tax=Lotus japonicus TaxID=34305 RepID=UPI002588DE01|nr:galactolipid galactosyltransferase SFR2, chloroplastic-like [Lotus japonicus]
MSPISLFIASTQLLGTLVTLTVAAKAFNFSRFLRPPIGGSVARSHRSDSAPPHHDASGDGQISAPAHDDDDDDDDDASGHGHASGSSISGISARTSMKFFLTSTKLVGALVTLVTVVVAVKTYIFSCFRRNYLRPFRSPIDESANILAKFDDGFFFGLATAPAHVEDDLDDAWLQFVQQTSGGAHNVAAWHNVPNPEERLKFWTQPNRELQLAKNTGITVFRMGIDWSRIMPKEPEGNNPLESINYAALESYKLILENVRSDGMKVMLTLFHHSLPPWSGEYGGWKVEKTVDYFMLFTRLIVTHLSKWVDYWVTFNEPHVFCMLTYCAGVWPAGDQPSRLDALPTGGFRKAMQWISIAHANAYDYIHETLVSSNPIVGVAHHVAFTRPYGLFDVSWVSLMNSCTLFSYIDGICNKLDFIGINYYGQEVVSGFALKLVEDMEYSESGRGVYPDGLYRMLLHFHERYKHLKLPFIITENGVSDETDLIRRPYLVEHLLAIHAAMTMGVPVLGYLFWTISDNWEWADGYGPKFGLVAVDRANSLQRTRRPSYHLFSEIAKTGKITREDREAAWDELQRAAKEKKTRPFYRCVNKHGKMDSGGLDEPIQRPYIERDWRFGHYEMHGLQDYLSIFFRFLMR